MKCIVGVKRGSGEILICSLHTAATSCKWRPQSCCTAVFLKLWSLLFNINTPEREVQKVCRGAGRGKGGAVCLSLLGRPSERAYTPTPSHVSRINSRAAWILCSSPNGAPLCNHAGGMGVVGVKISNQKQQKGVTVPELFVLIWRERNLLWRDVHLRPL